MKDIKDLLGKTTIGKRPDPKKKAPKGEGPAPHEPAAAVNMIRDAGLVTGKYGYTYWLGKLKRAKVSYGEMHGIMKKLGELPTKYNRGGWLTNHLTDLAKQRKSHESTH